MTNKFSKLLLTTALYAASALSSVAYVSLSAHATMSSASKKMEAALDTVKAFQQIDGVLGSMIGEMADEWRDAGGTFSQAAGKHPGGIRTVIPVGSSNFYIRKAIIDYNVGMAFVLMQPSQLNPTVEFPATMFSATFGMQFGGGGLPETNELNPSDFICLTGYPMSNSGLYKEPFIGMVPMQSLSQWVKIQIPVEGIQTINGCYSSSGYAAGGTSAVLYQ